MLIIKIHVLYASYYYEFMFYQHMQKHENVKCIFYGRFCCIDALVIEHTKSRA